MKKLNSKAFTLIELLAVITIMGILMIVAIPSVSRVIENTRRDNFLDTAKQYANGVKTMWISDSLACGSTSIVASAVTDGAYYVPIDSANVGKTVSGVNYPTILEQGGKSSWGSKHVKGYVLVVVSGASTGAAKTSYHVYLSDGVHGVSNDTIGSLDLKRADVSVSGVGLKTQPTGSKSINGKTYSSYTVCKEV